MCSWALLAQRLVFFCISIYAGRHSSTSVNVCDGTARQLGGGGGGGGGVPVPVRKGN